MRFYLRKVYIKAINNNDAYLLSQKIDRVRKTGTYTGGPFRCIVWYINLVPSNSDMQ